MKQYVLVIVLKDQTARSTYFEFEAPPYMYTKWENLMLEKPQLLKALLEKGPVRYTGIQNEDKFAIWTKFDESPIKNPLMELNDYEHLGAWKEALRTSGFFGKIFHFTEDETMLLLKLPGGLAPANKK